MHTKILKSESKVGTVYDNRGSSNRLVSYMNHETKEPNELGIYFTHNREGIDKDEVVEAIDHNVKGLRATDAKFYSLVISPSQAELDHIGSDENKLKAYTRQVMENYASNFKLKSGQELESKDLVWFAAIHREREYSGTDAEVKAGRARSGELKSGDQTHIHIIVSRRDQEQKISLTPLASKDRFNMKEWQRQNAADFQRTFHYEKQTYYSRKENEKETTLRERVEKFVERAGLDKSYLNPDRIVLMGKEQDYDWKFRRNLKHLEESLEKGLRPKNPYESLDREKLYKSYQTQREYNFDTKEENQLNKRLVNLKYNYLREHGIALSEQDISLKTVLEARETHAHKWKFYQNLKEVEEKILREGEIPKDFKERLSRPVSESEINDRKTSYKEKSQPLEVPAVPQKAAKEPLPEPLEKSSFKGKHSDLGRSESTSMNLQKGLSVLSAMLQAMENGSETDEEWSKRAKVNRGPKKQREYKERDYDSGLER